MLLRHPLVLLASLYSQWPRLSWGLPRALIYTCAIDFRHDSIPTAVSAITNFSFAQFDHTEDPSWFTDAGLSVYDVIIFLDNSGEVLDQGGKDAFEGYLRNGGNFVGIHSASDCLRNTKFYEAELGAWFDYHPEITNATVDVIDSSHPSTSMLPAEWHVQDEMYNFKSDPRAHGAVVILSARESSYSDPGPRTYNQGTPHPIAWYQHHTNGTSGAGRSWYTSLGHLNETWQDSTFLAHIQGGIIWALDANTTRAYNSSASVGSPQLQATSSSGGSGSTTGSTPSATQSFSSALTTIYNGILTSATYLTLIASLGGIPVIFSRFKSRK